MTFRSIIAGMFGVLLFASTVQAVETTLTVRVLAKDAKFVGTSMGGAAVTIRDVKTGALLAEGLTAGGTGNTNLIMNTPRARNGSITSEGSAHFTATIDLKEPRLIEVTARGPMNSNASTVSASSTMWVMPGKHINEGDAWFLELRGLVVEHVNPVADYAAGTSEVTLLAKVTMLCGCPTSPGGLWDADKMEIRAIITGPGQANNEIPLTFTGDASHFSAAMPVEAGKYDVTLYAFQPATGNTGVFNTSFEVK